MSMVETVTELSGDERLSEMLMISIRVGLLADLCILGQRTIILAFEHFHLNKALAYSIDDRLEIIHI